jgi:hypothetical protein
MPAPEPANDFAIPKAVALGVSVECCAGTKEVGWQFYKKRHVNLTDLREGLHSVWLVLATSGHTEQTVHIRW